MEALGVILVASRSSTCRYACMCSYTYKMAVVYSNDGAGARAKCDLYVL